MLMKIDNAFNHAPSFIINAVTGGSKGSTLCGRLYLYHKYISKTNYMVNSLMSLIDGIEKDHCKTSARHWRLGHKKQGCYFPKRYRKYL